MHLGHPAAYILWIKHFFVFDFLAGAISKVKPQPARPAPGSSTPTLAQITIPDLAGQTLAIPGEPEPPKTLDATIIFPVHLTILDLCSQTYLLINTTLKFQNFVPTFQIVITLTASRPKLTIILIKSIFP
jgi:hypothetical protein